MATAHAWDLFVTLSVSVARSDTKLTVDQLFAASPKALGHVRPVGGAADQ